METEITEIVGSLEQRDQRFREQVSKLRAFREVLQKAGTRIEAARYSVPLMQRIESPHESTSEIFRLSPTNHP
jgi:hypothetical protein